MATAKYDAKRKKIIIELDYDHTKNYPDNRPEGKSKALESNGNSRKIDGAPDNVWYIAALYEKKGKKGKVVEQPAAKPKAAVKKTSAKKSPQKARAEKVQPPVVED